MDMQNDTKPRPRFPKEYTVDPNTLAAGRYGTFEMVQIWGAEQTFDYSLRVQGQAAQTISGLYPEVISPLEAKMISDVAYLGPIDANRIRELEAKGGHDVIAINKALEEKVPESVRPHINKGKTSADTTEPAKALQIKRSLETIAETVENLRDIMIEKMLAWQDVPFMDTTHLYDALPTTAGRPFAHYVEMLASDLKVLNFFYGNSIVGKWADATGNHHSALTLGMDGIKLQEEYCKKLGIGWMDAPAQVPGLEFHADIFYSMARIAETVNNISKFVAWGRSDDVNVFINASPQKKKGSSAMPHKDAKNGNPDVEEQNMSSRNYAIGNLMTAMMNCEMPYARNLSASANERINFEDGFKFLDHAVRRLAEQVYWLKLREDRSIERVLRTYGIVTSPQVMNYLTDSRFTSRPMARSEAHDLVGALATKAWETRTSFTDVLLSDEQVTSRLGTGAIKEITDPLKYVGLSRRIIERVADSNYRKRTLEPTLFSTEYR